MGRDRQHAMELLDDALGRRPIDGNPEPGDLAPSSSAAKAWRSRADAREYLQRVGYSAESIITLMKNLAELTEERDKLLESNKLLLAVSSVLPGSSSLTDATVTSPLGSRCATPWRT